MFMSQEMQAHIEKINEMATVMRKAIEVDEGRLCEDEERIKRLEVRHAKYTTIYLLLKLRMQMPNNDIK